MIGRLLVLLAFVAAPCFAADKHYPTPSHDQIKAWWKPEKREDPAKEWDVKRTDPAEALEIKDVKPVRLKSGEQAFVASVRFPSRSRTSGWGILLVRPALQEARQTHSIASVSKVIYLFDDHISGVAITSSFTGQGYTSGYHAFLHFDDWQPVVIFDRGFGDNLSICGSEGTGHHCHSEEVTWFFTDLDGDHTEDLVELIVYKDGEEPDQLTWRTKVNAYLIKGKKFVPVSPGLIPSNLQESEGKPGSTESDPTDANGQKSPNKGVPEIEQPADQEPSPP
jgi:hypothetical protein